MLASLARCHQLAPCVYHSAMRTVTLAALLCALAPCCAPSLILDPPEPSEAGVAMDAAPEATSAPQTPDAASVEADTRPAPDDAATAPPEAAADVPADVAPESTAPDLPPIPDAPGTHTLCASDVECGTVNSGFDARCLNGRCVDACPANFGNCDGIITNGCETNLRRDRNHCGACGRSCPGRYGDCYDSRCN